ncbi:MAG: hypothetical protein SGPRY_011226, partial [Prymnesium sp.]
ALFLAAMLSYTFGVLLKQRHQLAQMPPPRQMGGGMGGAGGGRADPNEQSGRGGAGQLMKRNQWGDVLNQTDEG